MERVEIRGDEGAIDARLFLPEAAAVGPWPAVLFYMDGLGLRPSLFRMAQRFADAGHLVLAPNMYWRAGELAPFDPATVFAPGPERERLMKVALGTTPAMAMRDTAAFLRFLDAEPRARAGAIGCVGYCLGGLFAFTAAGTFPERVAAAAAVHGSRLATDQPDSPHLLAPKMRGEIYLGVAETDHGHTAETTARLEKAFGEAGVRSTIELYPGTTHGFAPDDTPVHDAAAAAHQLERVLALFGRALRG